MHTAGGKERNALGGESACSFRLPLLQTKERQVEGHEGYIISDPSSEESLTNLSENLGCQLLLTELPTEETFGPKEPQAF